MSTFIINLNDTIALSDFAVVELAKVINTCQPCVQVAETNCNDVLIVGIICIAIIAVAFFAQRTILKWKEKVITATEKERKEKESEESIAQRKQKADLMDKYLDFLKGLTSCKEYVSIDDYEKLRKEYLKKMIELKQCVGEGTQNDLQETIEKVINNEKTVIKVDEDRSKHYQRVLAYLIELSQKDNFNSINRADLEDTCKVQSDETKNP